MNIKELQVRQGNIEVTGTIADKGQVRQFNKDGKQLRVCDSTLQDDTGKVKLSLWNEQVDLVNVGDTVKISKGYVNEWQGEKQLSTGKFGTLEVVKKGNGAPAQPVQQRIDPKPKVQEEPLDDDLKDDDFSVKEEDVY